MSEEYEYEDDFEEYDGTPPPTPTFDAPPPAATAAEPSIAVPPSPESPPIVRSPPGKPWALITLDELELGDRMAAGAMGAVFAGWWRGRSVAAKTLHDTGPAALAKVEAELLVHAALRHPRVVELCGANLTPPGCCIVMEQCECSLFEQLHKRRAELGRRQSLRVALDVAEGMLYLHTRNPPVVHRDLKSHNVLLAFDGSAKLCDFGLVGTREIAAGTPNYMARRSAAHTRRTEAHSNLT